MTKFIFNEEDTNIESLVKLFQKLKHMSFDIHVKHKYVFEIYDELNAIDVQNILEEIDDIVGLDLVDNICINR